MGLEPGKDFEKGNSCDLCWPGNTPKFMRVTFSGIINCPGFPIDQNKSHIMWQGGPCGWFFAGDGVIATYEAVGFIHPPKFTSINLTDIATGLSYFWGKSEGICGTGVGNDLVVADCGIMACGFDGSASVAWGPGIHP